MKKLLIISSICLVFVFAGCKKNINTTYTYTDNKQVPSMQPYMTNWIDYIREYDDSGQCIATQSISYPVNGKEYTFTADSKTVKVKIYVDWKLTSGFSQSKKWVQQVYNLTKNGNTKIVIDNNTLMGVKEP